MDSDIERDTIGACITACNECRRVCLGHVRHCLDIGGEHAEADHIAMLLTSAQVCSAAVELMTIDSEWHPIFCDLCAQVCEDCADECAAMGEMEDCVAACRQCVQSCRQMVAESTADVPA